jgi:hypothetical protein
MKNVCIACFFIMVLLTPLASAVQSSQYYSDHVVYCDYSTLETPDWATHEFRGVIGVTDELGHPLKPVRYIAGYCKDSFKGKFLGVIVDKNEAEPREYFGGLVKGPFLLGFIDPHNADKRLPCVGIGGNNATHFYFRLMLIQGPTYYIAGKFNPMV